MSLLAAVRPNSDAPAIIIPGGGPQLSYSDYRNAIEDLQASLAGIGLQPNQAVSISLGNTLEFAVSFIAIANHRCIAAPLNPNYKQEEFEFYIDDIKSALILLPKGEAKSSSPAVLAAKKFGAGVAEISYDVTSKKCLLNLLEKGSTLGSPTSVAKAQTDDVALVLHTSGTTGRPKAVPLTHRNLVQTMKNVVETYKLTSADKTLLVMPLFHVHGLLAGFLAPLRSGGVVIIPQKFSASTFWKDFVQHGATWYTAVPTIHQMLLRSELPNPIPKIRFIRSCSSTLAPNTFHSLEKAFQAPVLEAYAMTEAAHQMTSNPLPPAKRKPGSVGIGQGVSVKILDLEGEEVSQGSEGEICVKGENVTSGYLNNPKANETSYTKSGYFRTGDQGKVDVDSYVIITGRIKEIVNRGGEKIAPVEIDSILLDHPAVAEAVAFAVPDELFGQDIHAAVVLKTGQNVSEEDLRAFVGKRVVKFKVPRRIYFTDVMPKTATGKIQRKNISEAFFQPEPSKARL